MQRHKLISGVLLIIAAVAIAFAFPSVREAVFGAKADLSNYVLADVKQDRFSITVTQRGTVSSLRESMLSSRVEGLTTIIFVAPEGSVVQGPLRSTIAGKVIDIQKSGGHLNIIVQPPAVLIGNRFVQLHVPGRPVSHTIDAGKFTKPIVEVGDIVDERDMLAGDIVCELDSSAIVDKERQQQIAVTQGSADVEKARKNIEIQINQNQSDQAKARLDEDLAKLDLKKFVEGERSQQANELRGSVLIAQEELTQNEESYQYFKRLAKKGYKNQVELETARVAVVKAKNKLAVAREKLKVLTDYTFERTYKELKEKAAETGRELKRVRLQGLAALAQFRAELNSKRLTLSVQLAKLRLLQEQIKACRMVAPQAGKVIYVPQESRGREPTVIEEGTTVYQRQRIISLPDFSQMRVKVKIPEAKINNVREGLETKISVDALPGRVFRGVIMDVPDVPVRGDWPNRDLMLFVIDVLITDKQIADLKPGMNAKVDIIADERDDIVQAPVQSVLSIGGKHVSWVIPAGGSQVERRDDIEIGATNNQVVEIVSGLKPGDRVVMNAKKQFEREIAELRSQWEGEESKRRKSRLRAGKSKSRRKKRTARKQPDIMAGFRQMDKNKDGVLEKSEVPAQIKSNFDKMDADKNGKINKTEWRKAIEAWMKKSRGGR